MYSLSSLADILKNKAIITVYFIMMSNYFKYRENITIIKEGVQVVRNGCKNPTVREAAILQKIADTLGTGSFCKDAVDERVAKVIISELDVQVISKRMEGRLIPN